MSSSPGTIRGRSNPLAQDGPDFTSSASCSRGTNQPTWMQLNSGVGNQAAFLAADVACSMGARSAASGRPGPPSCTQVAQAAIPTGLITTWGRGRGGSGC